MYARLNDRPLSELTTDEITQLLKKIVAASSSDHDLKDRLRREHFNHRDAGIISRKVNGKYVASLSIRGPAGQKINV